MVIVVYMTNSWNRTDYRKIGVWQLKFARFSEWWAAYVLASQTKCFLCTDMVVPRVIRERTDDVF